MEQNSSIQLSYEIFQLYSMLNLLKQAICWELEIFNPDTSTFKLHADPSGSRYIFLSL